MRLPELRPHQIRAIEGVKERFREGKRRPVIHLPTGAGKTIIATHIVDGARKKGKRINFTVPIISLVDQTLSRFVENGIDLADIGVHQADHSLRRPQAPIQIISVQTAARRGWPEADLVICDEAHVQFDALDEYLDAHAATLFVALTATPWAKGMGDRWDCLISPTSIDELTELGFLAPLRAFAPSKPDLTGVKTVAGDYHQGQLSDRMSQKEIVGDVVSTWLKEAENRPTLVFAVDRAHAAALQGQFEAVGISCAYVDANTPREERGKILADLNSGALKVISSIDTMSMGVDADVRCISYCAPTKSEMRWVQRIGRGLRPKADGSDCLLLDHSGTALRLGLPNEIHHTTLRTAASDEAAKARKEPELKKPIECPSCTQLIPVGSQCCPGCGFKPQRVSTVRVVEGDLIEIGGSKSAKKEQLSKQQFLAELKGFAEENSKSSSWVMANFRAKTNEWPHHSIKGVAPAYASNKVRAWIRSRQIAWAKGKQAAQERQANA